MPPRDTGDGRIARSLCRTAGRPEPATVRCRAHSAATLHSGAIPGPLPSMAGGFGRDLRAGSAPAHPPQGGGGRARRPLPTWSGLDVVADRDREVGPVATLLGILHPEGRNGDGRIRGNREGSSAPRPVEVAGGATGALVQPRVDGRGDRTVVGAIPNVDVQEDANLIARASLHVQAEAPPPSSPRAREKRVSVCDRARAARPSLAP